jgi:hypothetical protein
LFIIIFLGAREMKKILALLAMISMTSLVGCGLDSTSTEAEVNDLAKAVLPGTWTDSTGTVALTFDENCQITGFTFTELPEELTGLVFDGSTFNFTIPDVGMSVSASLTLLTANVADDGTVTIEYEGALEGFLGTFDPGYVVITLTGSLDDVGNPTTFTGSLTAVARPSSMLQTLLGLASDISIASDVTFAVNKTE